MPLTITAWNIDPNRVWFVRLADAGSTISVELYTTLADAQAQSNPQATGYTTGFGSSLAVTLTNATGAAYPVSLYQPTYPWHLKVSGTDGDLTTIFRIKEFVDLDEIDHAVYRNADLIPLRAAAEIDAHTHVKYIRSLQCALPILAAQEGAIGSIESARRTLSELGQVTLQTITGTPNSLLGSLEVVTHKALKR
jgi:hypothetical protein